MLVGAIGKLHEPDAWVIGTHAAVPDPESPERAIDMAPALAIRCRAFRYQAKGRRF